MDYVKFNSMQDFGYNRFSRGHSVIGSYNAGAVYPLGCFDVPMGATISNNLDIFARSSALGDPSFLDCDVSVGHYFVSYEAMDHWFKIRCQKFKGTLQDQPLFQLFISADTPLEEVQKIFGPGTLADHLGFGIRSKDNIQGTLGEDIYLPLGPFIAYQMIIDRFFRNSRLQNVERTKEAVLNFFSKLNISSVEFGEATFSDIGMYNLQYYNFEPDYFTSSRPESGGPDIKIPGFDHLTGVAKLASPAALIPTASLATGAVQLGEDLSGATIHNLLDRMLLQKVADMLERGGYSYNDYARILYGVQPGDESAEYPIFLSGGNAPLQVSTVVNQTQSSSQPDPAVALGSQAGNVSAYLNKDNSFTRRFDRPGIYIPCLWIRPSTYYQSGISPIWFQNTLGSKLIPQLADMQDAPIYACELDSSVDSLAYDFFEKPVFGYKDRYQEYRTTPNRIVGEMRNKRVGWYMARNIVTRCISPEFLDSSNLKYTPWVVTSSSVDHFFCRIHHNFWNSVPLPATSRPYVW